jgi:hypothetical protein
MVIIALCLLYEYSFLVGPKMLGFIVSNHHHIFMFVPIQYQRGLLVAFLLVIPLYAFGQSERSTDDSAVVSTTEAETLEAANYNNTRSNRASVAAPEELATTTPETDSATTTDRAQNHNSSRSNRTEPIAIDANVCDGVTCADGSCAPTIDECTLEAGRTPATTVCPGNGSDCDDGDPAVRPDQPTCGIDDDCDGTLDEDEVLTGDASVIFDTSQPSPVSGDTIDCDDNDECRRPDAVQSVNSNSHNELSPPSNPVREPDYLDDDDDGDGVPTGTELEQSTESRATLLWREGQFERPNTPSETPTSDTDWTHCWGKGEDATGVVHSWGDGLCVSLPDTVPATATSTADTDYVPTITLDGTAVRAWSESERTAWQTFTTSIENPSPIQQLSSRLIQETQADERIIDIQVQGDDEPDSDVSINYRPIVVRYQTPINLFGFIPMEREVQAAIDTQGSVTIDYPWYSFLATTPATETINTLLHNIADVAQGNEG